MFEPSRGKYKYTIHFSVNRYSLTAIPFVNLVFFGLFSTIYTVQPKLQKKQEYWQNSCLYGAHSFKCKVSEMSLFLLDSKCLFLLPLNIIESLMMYHTFLWFRHKEGVYKASVFLLYVYVAFSLTKPVRLNHLMNSSTKKGSLIVFWLTQIST